MLLLPLPTTHLDTIGYHTVLRQAASKYSHISIESIERSDKKSETVEQFDPTKVIQNTIRSFTTDARLSGNFHRDPAIGRPVRANRYQEIGSWR